MLSEQVIPTSADGTTTVAVTPGLVGKDEVELKLLAPAGVMEQLRTAPVIMRHARDAETARRLEAVYYDTRDRILFSHGLSLRVRSNGDRYVQTLKRNSIHGRPFVRREWETSVDAIVPDIELFPVSEIGAPLQELSADELNAIFVTKVRRCTQRLELSGAVVEVAFDEGSIEAGERSEPLTEIELEVKAGNPRVLYDLGIELLDVAPLRIATQSKADRGYRLAFDMPHKPTRATAPAITDSHRVDDLVGALLGNCVDQLLANQAIAEAGQDPEGVHQMRVALRRMRTACGLLRNELASPALRAFSSEAGWLAKSLGAAREWDVFLTQTLTGPSAALASETIDFAALREAAERHRATAYEAVRESLASKRYNRFQLAFRHWLESKGWRSDLAAGSLAVLLEPAPAFSAKVLTQLHGKALKRGRHFRHLSPEARHELRIALKKLRYASEFFGHLYGGTAEARIYMSALAKLQDALGQHNDASMTRPLLETLMNDGASPATHRAIGTVMGWQARDHVEVELTLRKHWSRFRAMPVFWTM